MAREANDSQLLTTRLGPSRILQSALTSLTYSWHNEPLRQATRISKLSASPSVGSIALARHRLPTGSHHSVCPRRWRRLSSCRDRQQELLTGRRRHDQERRLNSGRQAIHLELLAGLFSSVYVCLLVVGARFSHSRLAPSRSPAEH